MNDLTEPYERMQNVDTFPEIGDVHHAINVAIVSFLKLEEMPAPNWAGAFISSGISLRCTL
jgi:hypothetical protein